VRPTVQLQGPRRHHAGRDPARRSRHGAGGRTLAASVRAGRPGDGALARRGRLRRARRGRWPRSRRATGRQCSLLAALPARDLQSRPCHRCNTCTP